LGGPLVPVPLIANSPGDRGRGALARAH